MARLFVTLTNAVFYADAADEQFCSAPKFGVISAPGGLTAALVDCDTADRYRLELIGARLYRTCTIVTPTRECIVEHVEAPWCRVSGQMHLIVEAPSERFSKFSHT